ncbi:Tubulin-tyrosine ligase family protein [Toxoplasma gondii TgCatPRC2]|uniref:Tubulin--tyrosine ligase-like protein 9 n=4 Tax=Toxoplasma gondii TaxID=5811 RepID=A0A125YSA6_TOXGV|nr:Tubulin-tyrosine ligase family protein [Toxoplasma gondii ME49]EPT25272.1 Tubulin-tyrosine ligase family protein [Toxoplasma gondii ME49]ESS34588.1 Tubulin-tyrosine ligase family protein [Toxoplasma gondii VEG]KYF40403.1 Tubulin-tyrosine ligase family protein [Toxoplasma gondii ARI]KYK65349.1 Tubulin-tyrosine ligase family protein [Toxoplasma gondii TgCatPRC2]|eukprot:XP_018635108.1 Tubulin-tyrosine ligase family protein [Toxoplasma gondii ME49]
MHAIFLKGTTKATHLQRVSAGCFCCLRPPIRFRSAFHNTVYDALKNRGWKETDSDTEWDFFWCDKEWMSENFDKFRFQPHQRVNHFRNHYELTRKDLLIRNLRRHRRQLERDGKIKEAQSFNICPTTFLLPLEYSMLVEEFRKRPNTLWIMKPIGRSQGRGIFLFERLSQISEWKNDGKWKKSEPVNPRKDKVAEEPHHAEAYVCQRYIQDPLLIGGKKFDLRLYACVTSYSPLTVYLHRGGFARFSHTHFSMEVEHRGNLCMHLTNVAIQRFSENYDEELGGKWSLRNVKQFLITKYGETRVNELMLQIQQLMLKPLIAVSKVMINDKHCFELYGYDIIIDAQLKPWLLEVNASPSLTASTPLDYSFKIGLLDDVLTIVDMEKFLAGDEQHIGGFVLLYKGGPVNEMPAECTTLSYLGTDISREVCLKYLGKKLAAAQRSATAAGRSK